jgi:hypothetical protein
MGWFSAKKPEYRLLQERSTNRSVVIWLRDAARRRDAEFVSEILEAEVARLPRVLVMAMASGATLKSRMVVEAGDGACELQIEVPADVASAEAGIAENGASRLCKAAAGLSALSVAEIEEQQAALEQLDEANMLVARGTLAQLEAMIAKGLRENISFVESHGSSAKECDVKAANEVAAAVLFMVIDRPGGKRNLFRCAFMWRGNDGNFYAGLFKLG